jgi:hypothetical protein
MNNWPLESTVDPHLSRMLKTRFETSNSMLKRAVLLVDGNGSCSTETAIHGTLVAEL